MNDALSIHCIPVYETNCYLLRTSAGSILVDPGPPRGADRLIAELQTVGVRPGDIHLILVTHGHLDHYGNALAVQAWCGAPVGAHPIAARYSQDRRNAVPPGQTLQGSVVRLVYGLLSPWIHVDPLHADISLDENSDLSAYGVPASTILLPGHAPGSLGVLTAESDCLVGDLFVNYTVPSEPVYMSDRSAWRVSRERIRARNPRTLYPGHGDPFPGTALDRIYPARFQLRWWVR
jgi:glyoxylase-like metal-dependent hydrolase (beta-lactamase superfamily II)